MPPAPPPPVRTLLAVAHCTNGLANRFAGLRGALRFAEATGRRLVVEWAPGGQEANWLEPYHGIGWRFGPAPGSLRPSDLDSPRIFGAAARRDVERFVELARSPAPLVVASNLYHDASHTPMADANISHCYAQYQRLFQPSPKLLQMVVDHIVEVGLCPRPPSLPFSCAWHGLQIRRSDHIAKSHPKHHGQREPHLTSTEVRGVERALAEAVDGLDERRLFLTTNSRAVQRHVARLYPGVCTSKNASHLRHSSPTTGGYLGPLLEFLTLAGSARIVGTAGSSFAAEAAYFGNVQRLTLGDWGTFNMLAPATRVFGTRNVSRPVL